MVEHIDALGAKTSYAYDLHGNVTSKTDALGNVTAYETDLAGNMTALTQANGAVYRYGYDALNRIESVTTPKGYIKTFSYDAQGNLSEESDNLGSRTSYAYDALHSMLSAENARGGQNSFFYDGAGNLVKETDGSGAATTYAYDLAGRLVKTTDALGATSSYAYDAVGNVVASTSPKGSSSSYSYDGNGNMTASQDALGNVTTYSYDGNDRLEKVVDPRGFSTSTSYDAVDRVIGTVDAKGAVTSYEYDAAGNVTSIENAKGFATAYAYDPLGRLEKVTSAEGDVTKYSYDAMGNLTAVEDAMGRATSYGYDQENNLVRIESPSGSIESFEFDIANRLEAVVSPDGSSVRYDYDELNNLVEKSYSIDPGQAVLYSYDALGRCSSRNDAVGDASYERDALGRIVKETDAYGQTLAYAYDEDGNLSSVAYPDGSRVSYGYDAAGNLTSVESAEGRYAYAYDAAGNPVSLTRPDKTATSYEYDASGRIVKLVNADAAGTVISSYAYSYDETGLVRSEDATTTAPDGTTVHAARTFSYTADEKLKSFEEHAGDGAITVSYEHDVVGNRIRQTKTSSEGAETIAYEYDADNRLVKAVSSTEGTTTYAYDANGNMTAKDAEDADAVTYDYGVENRLAAVREGGRLLMAASYDGDGNRVLQVNLYHTREHERANGAEAGPAGTGAGGAGSEEEGVSSSDGDGDGEAGSPSVDLFWYGASLGAACCGSGANPALMAPAVRLVDALWERGWMRMGKLALSGGDPSLVDADALAQLGLSQGDAEAVAASVASIPQERSYLQENYDLTTYVNATVGDLTQVMGETSALSGTTRYTYGLSRLASVDREGESSGYLADGRGSVTAVLDGAGKVSSAYSYGPYGEPEALGAGEGVGELPFFGYNAEEHDPATGQQYLRARYYQVAEGVFGVCDTVLGALVNPLSLNRYLYAEGNPVMKADPTGHRASFASSFGKMVVSAVANLVKQVIRKAIVGIGNAFSASSEPALKSKGNQMLIQQSAADVRNLKIAYYCGSAGYMRFNTGNDTSSLHTALDVGGLIPGCGMIFDAVNGIWYLAEGDTDNAKWSLTAFIPAVGDIASIGKMAGKAGKAADTASGAGKAADTASGAGKAAIVAGKVDDLPEHAREMYEKYDAAGWRGNVSGQAQGTRAGKEYQNNGQDGSVRLPEGEADGEKIIYREFDINDKVPGQSRDGERFLKGTDGSVYYTNDHYHSVIKVK